MTEVLVILGMPKDKTLLFLCIISIGHSAAAGYLLFDLRRGARLLRDIGLQ